ncbi:hypothetical protein MHK_007337, partial [Candidatus Magnetomorum sp. HK-1]
MLIIRDEQINAFKNIQLQKFINRAIKFVQQQLPNLKDENVSIDKDRIRKLILKAQNYGFSIETHIMNYEF